MSGPSHARRADAASRSQHLHDFRSGARRSRPTSCVRSCASPGSRPGAERRTASRTSSSTASSGIGSKSSMNERMSVASQLGAKPRRVEQQPSTLAMSARAVQVIHESDAMRTASGNAYGSPHASIRAACSAGASASPRRGTSAARRASAACPSGGRTPASRDRRACGPSPRCRSHRGAIARPRRQRNRGVLGKDRELAHRRCSSALENRGSPRPSA